MADLSHIERKIKALERYMKNDVPRKLAVESVKFFTENFEKGGFVDRWMPPNDWGCKCRVRQVAKPDKFIEPPTDIKQPPAVIQNNPGKTGKAFTDGHPMIKQVSKTAKEEIEREFSDMYARLISDEIFTWAKKELSGKMIKAKDKPDILITTKKIKTILSKPVKKKWLKNIILRHLDYYYKKSKYVSFTKEIKGRQKYRYWYYYEVRILNEKYYLNIVMLSNGEKRLHAITDNIK
ncbi:MAG: hypothetical protein KatS3mg034_1360 [Vicingaceae bacterium]|nr:MAG: hypothetical protein KatS3mg034_1360 [Vicingaceae bacterium]